MFNEAFKSRPSLDEFSAQPFDYLITVCDNAKEHCPVFSGSAKRIHWNFDDPASAVGDNAAQLMVFRRERDKSALVQVNLLKFDDTRLRLGIAYRLTDGSIVYVPEKGKTTGETNSNKYEKGKSVLFVERRQGFVSCAESRIAERF